MILDLVKPYNSRLIKGANTIAAIIIISGMISGMALKDNKTYIPLSLIGTGMLFLIVISIYRYFKSKTYIKVGQIHLRETRISAINGGTNVEIEYASIQELKFKYRGYQDRPSHYGFGIHSGSGNLLCISTNESNYKFEIFLKSKYQKDEFVKQIEKIKLKK